METLRNKNVAKLTSCTIFLFWGLDALSRFLLHAVQAAHKLLFHQTPFSHDVTALDISEEVSALSVGYGYLHVSGREMVAGSSQVGDR